MKKIIIDTDIGNDSDDAGALAIAFRLEELNECKILAITSNTSRIDGATCADAISYYYHKNPLIGMTKRKDFLDEKGGYGAYSRAVSENYFHRFKNKEIPDAVKVLRETLIKSDELITLITLGPLNNIADLIKTDGCELSPLSGLELINTKVKNIVLMGGHFSPPHKTVYFEKQKLVVEWNIKQDVKSAQIVVSNVLVPILFVPFVPGLIKTGAKLFNTPNYDSPIKLSYLIHNKGPRESWDPITVYTAIRNPESLFEISNKGRALIDDKGVTTFIENKDGNHQFLNKHLNENDTINILNELII